jgi:hypothetical protein
MYLSKEDIIYRIDLVADTQRWRMVGDPVRTFEYQAAESDAVAYRDAGFQGTVPPFVACWADARGWTAQQAAEDILTEAARFRYALIYLRTVRLKAKYQVLDPNTTIEQANAIAEAATNQLKAIG